MGDQENWATVLERALDLLIAVTGASGGGVWRIDGREGELLHGSGVDQRAIRRCRLAREYDQLRCGPLVAEGYAILPTRLLVGGSVAFYLEAPADLGRRIIEVNRLLAQVTSCLEEKEPDAPERTSAIERRRALEALCDREEWCLARVARRLGISRPTLYRRLSDYGLGRPGGPKRHPVRHGAD